MTTVPAKVDRRDVVIDLRVAGPRAFPARDLDLDRLESVKVVYVDDDSVSRDLLVEFFRLFSDLQLIVASNVHDARAAIDEHRPAVVVADAWLGHTCADSFVAEVLAGSRPDAPRVVILSADANATTVARFRRLGVSSYMRKPIDLGILARVMRELARGVDAQHEGIGSSARTITASGN